jgi:hypothetical protein
LYQASFHKPNIEYAVCAEGYPWQHCDAELAEKVANSSPLSIFQLLTRKHNDDQPIIAIRLETLTKTITYWDNIHEIVKKIPQKQFDGNQCIRWSHGKREKCSCGNKHQSVTHKASDHHLRHERQQLAVITPH